MVKFVDGVAVYSEDLVYFNDWLKEKHDISEAQLRTDLLEDEEYLNEENPEDHSLVEEKMGEYKEEFYEWAEQYELTPEDC